MACPWQTTSRKRKCVSAIKIANKLAHAVLQWNVNCPNFAIKQEIYAKSLGSIIKSTFPFIFLNRSTLKIYIRMFCVCGVNYSIFRMQKTNTCINGKKSNRNYSLAA